MKVTCPECGVSHTSQARRLIFRCHSCGAAWPNPNGPVQKGKPVPKAHYPGNKANLIPGAKYRNRGGEQPPPEEQKPAGREWQPPQKAAQTEKPEREHQETRRRKASWWDREVL